jgi:hypothetical protein
VILSQAAQNFYAFSFLVRLFSLAFARLPVLEIAVAGDSIPGAHYSSAKGR